MPLPMVRATSLAPYLAATRGTFSNRSASAEVELMMARPLGIFCNPASMADRFVVSKEMTASGAPARA